LLRMKRGIVLFAIVAMGVSANAQRYNLGVGIKAGVTNFLGDIGGGDLARGFLMNMQMKETRWAIGPAVSYRFHPLFGVEGNINYFRLGGEDADCENYARLGRNLSFRNDAWDFNAKLMWYPQILSISDVGYRGVYELDYHTYFFVGLGGVLSTPKAEYNGDWVKLRKLMTEGEKYSPFSLIVPIGGGLFFTYKRYHRIGFELSWNLTMTDYLDDISKYYVDPSVMGSNPLAPSLANRYDAGIYGIPGAEQYGPGSPRGYSERKLNNDNYILMTFSYYRQFRTKNSFYRRNYSWMYGKKQKWGGTKAKF